MGGFQEVILPRLWPDDLGWVMAFLAIWRFVILFLALIVLFMQPEGSTFLVVLLGATGVFMIMDSIWVFSAYPDGIDAIAWCNHNRNLGTLLIRIVAFALPLFVAGATRNKKSRGWAIMLALLGAGYFFTTWFVFQRVDNCIV